MELSSIHIAILADSAYQEVGDRKSEMNMSPEQIETDIATYWLEDGILVSRSKSVRRTVDNLRESHKIIKQMTGGKKLPHLVFLTRSAVPDKDAREFSTASLPDLYTAMALVSNGGLGTFIMNLLFKMKPPTVPMRSFSNEADAREWLKGYM